MKQTRRILSPAGWLYGKIADLRNLAYDRGLFHKESLGIPAISIGNLTVGGTGKTPLVRFAARTLADAGATVAVISRGYGRENERAQVIVSDGRKILADAPHTGDEPLELAQDLLGTAVVICDADRGRASQTARREFGATVAVLDDAYQHRRALRALDILVIDALDPFGGGSVLPAGRLREPLSGIARADLVIVTRADLAADAKKTIDRIHELNPPAPVLSCVSETYRITPAGSSEAAGSHSTLTDLEATPLKKRRALTFCGLGNPAGFFLQLRNEGFRIVKELPFPDHYRYSSAVIADIREQAEECGADLLITTRKDEVKISSDILGMECVVVRSRLRFENGERNQLVGAILDATGSEEN